MTNQCGLTFAQSARILDFTGFLASNSIGSDQSGLTKHQCGLDGFSAIEQSTLTSFPESLDESQLRLVTKLMV